MPPARRPRCTSPRRSAASCGPDARARPRASFCHRCRRCCSWRVSLRHNAITCWASRIGRPTNWRPHSAARPRRPKPTTGSMSLGADAELDQVIFDGSSFGTATPAGSDEEADYLGLPGLLDANQMRELLLRRRLSSLTVAAAAAPPPPNRSPARATARPAPRTQRFGVGGTPSNGQAARVDSQRAAPHVRRTSGRRGQLRPAAGAHRGRAWTDRLTDRPDAVGHPRRCLRRHRPRLVFRHVDQRVALGARGGGRHQGGHPGPALQWRLRTVQPMMPAVARQSRRRSRLPERITSQRLSTRCPSALDPVGGQQRAPRRDRHPCRP